MVPVSETVLLELVRQAPQLCVLSVIVWRFIRTIDHLHQQMSESSLRCHDVQRATLVAISHHSEAVQALTNEVRELGNGRSQTKGRDPWAVGGHAGQPLTEPATFSLQTTSSRPGAKED